MEARVVIQSHVHPRKCNPAQAHARTVTQSHAPRRCLQVEATVPATLEL